ncbi:hypothetical protein A0J61_10332 [Choanephora cucurbitarum]|uniref:Uncharacterized protein n=1 Tax=Choanephora cucurbitarum TaxID=101091 RepID=A0A1C7MXU1_9FUNG|nr:hypothetical protein A0J61_10332 [Choanephora cucurbitarum]
MKRFSGDYVVKVDPITDFDLLRLEVLVEEWYGSLRKYMDPKGFTIHQHYLEHLTRGCQKTSTCRKSAVTLWREEQEVSRPKLTQPRS